MSYKQLKFAREFRGLTQTELSSAIPGLSQSNLSKYEKGMNTLSDETQHRILEYLGFPIGFLSRKINNPIEGNYRKRASTSKTSMLAFESKCRLIGYLVDEMSDSIEWPEFSFHTLDVQEGFSPEYAAQITRRFLKIEDGDPVIDIFEMLEQNGIIVYEIDGEDKFDGLSFFTDQGYPIIILNRNFTNDRKRFTLAHELGHLILHSDRVSPISELRDKENEANTFAAEFLMPKNAIIQSLRKLKLSDLGELKTYWLTSMASICLRALHLKCITIEKYLMFKRELSRQGYSKKEPIDVYIDKAYCFKNAYSLFVDELSYDMNDFVQTFAISEDVINDIFNFNTIRVKTHNLSPHKSLHVIAT